jgi:hypothetical protein
MAVKKKRAKTAEARHMEDTIDIKAYKDAGLIPAKFYDKKTGDYMGAKTFYTSRSSKQYGSDQKLGPKFTKWFNTTMKKKYGLDMSEEEYLARVAKAEKQIRMKKATGPELTTPPKKRKGAAKGALIGPKYRHGHKDYRNGGTATRMK